MDSRWDLVEHLSGSKVKIAQMLQDAGAMLIVGQHPHKVHGIALSVDSKPEQMIEGKHVSGIILYSFGSTLWTMKRYISAILQVKMKDGAIHFAFLIPTIMKGGVLVIFYGILDDINVRSRDVAKVGIDHHDYGSLSNESG
jgi:hypothetical protein